MKQYSWILALVIGLLIFLPSGSVRADIAPPPPPRGANVAPGSENTSVRMLAETVVLDIPSTSKEKTWNAGVTANFTMRNLGKQSESMMVRFPMFISDEYGGTECDLNSPYPEIQNFGARVNGGAVDVTYDTFTADIPPRDGNPGGSVKRHCWASFPAVFAPGKDVTITVTYGVVGNYIDHGVLTNYLRFSYILVTGAGWKDTIGSADIIVRLPYPADDRVIYEASTGAVMDKNEVRWHFDNLEPERNIALTILNPLIVAAIQRESRTVSENPKDGEAWGRLGKANKEAWMFERGYREGPGAADLLTQAAKSYQKALELLPKDADWHYGYADLLCWQVEWPTNSNDPEAAQILHDCVAQLKLALDINPNHAKAKDRLGQLAENSFLGKDFLDLSGAKPNYLILTPGNYKTVTPYPTSTFTPAPKVTATRAQPTATTAVAEVQATDTPAAPAATDTAAPVSPSPTAPATAQPAAKPALPFCGSLVVPLLAGVLLLFFQFWQRPG